GRTALADDGASAPALDGVGPDGAAPTLGAVEVVTVTAGPAVLGCVLAHLVQPGLGVRAGAAGAVRLVGAAQQRPRVHHEIEGAFVPLLLDDPRVDVLVLLRRDGLGRPDVDRNLDEAVVPDERLMAQRRVAPTQTPVANG